MYKCGRKRTLFNNPHGSYITYSLYVHASTHCGMRGLQMLQGPLPQSAAAAGWPTGHTPTFNIYCRWPTGHAPTFNIYCRWPTGHAPTFLAHILQVAHRARPYSSSSGSQQGYPTCIPPLTTALLTTRGVLCQRHSPYIDSTYIDRHDMRE